MVGVLAWSQGRTEFTKRPHAVCLLGWKSFCDFISGGAFKAAGESRAWRSGLILAGSALFLRTSVVRISLYVTWIIPPCMFIKQFIKHFTSFRTVTAVVIRGDVRKTRQKKKKKTYPY